MRGADEGADAEDALKRAWRRFVALLAADRPLAIGVDDAHWADEGTLNLLEEAAFGLSEAPVIILCTCRPELAERLPDFGRAARNHTQIELCRWMAFGDPPRGAPPARGPAPDRGADRRRRGREPVLHARRSREPFERSGGGPRAPPRHRAGRDRRSDRPASAEEKRALQIASRARPHLRAGPAGGPARRDPAELLWSLRRRALVEERTTSEAGSYAFRHQLIRDVAYSSLPRGERAGLHEQAARALMSREPFAERAELARLPPRPRKRAETDTRAPDRRLHRARRSRRQCRSPRRRGSRTGALRGGRRLSEGAEQVDCADRRRRRRATALARRSRHPALIARSGRRRSGSATRVPRPATHGRSRSARG